MHRLSRVGGLVLSLFLAVGAVFALVGPASAGEPYPIPATRHHGVKPTPTPPPVNAWHPGAGPLTTAKPKHANGSQVRPLANPTVADLSVSTNRLWPSQYVTVTASTNADVGPTPYYLSIYEVGSSTYVAVCGTGTTCSASITRSSGRLDAYVAVLSFNPNNTIPPPGEIASSPQQFVTWVTDFVSLAVDNTTVPVGGQATLTATSTEDVGPSPFYIEIYDLTTNTFVNDCGLGTSCAAAISQTTARTDEFVAYVANLDTAAPPPSGVQAVSQQAFVTWSNSGWRVSLNATTSDGNNWVITATANQDVRPSPWYIELFNENGQFLTNCAVGTSCSYATFLGPFARMQVVAFVSSTDNSLPPSNIQASSNTRFVIGNVA